MKDMENRNPSLSYSTETYSEPVIFRYQLLDAWRELISQVDILDVERENVRCIYPCRSWYHQEGEMPSAQSVKLSGEDIRKIRNILLSQIDLFEIEELEQTFCLDGFLNGFLFSVAGMENIILGDNLWIFDEGKEPSEKAEIVLNVFHKIKKILLDAGVEKKYLVLALEDE